MLWDTEDQDASRALEPAWPTTAKGARSARIRPHAAAVGPLPACHPLAYRHVVADWPVEWRERWGRRANELEEAGLPWRDAEAQAFVEVWNALRHGPCSYGLGASEAERN